MTSERKNREEVLVSISVAVLASKMSGDGDVLLLVQKASNGKWSLPAGGLKKGDNGKIETVSEALNRELFEEAGINLNKMDIRPQIAGVVNIRHPSKDKNSLGVVYRITLEPGFNDVDSRDEGEIQKAKFFTLSEIYHLLSDPRSHLNRPDFNDGLIRWWVRNWWTHDNLGDVTHRDGEITEELITRFAEEKAWF